MFSSPFNGSFQSFGSMSQILVRFELVFTKMGFGSNLLILTNGTILLGRQYYILYRPNNHFLNFLVCSFLPFGNQKPMSHREKVFILLFC
jgi:hypothetical protein